MCWSSIRRQAVVGRVATAAGETYARLRTLTITGVASVLDPLVDPFITKEQFAAAADARRAQPAGFDFRDRNRLPRCARSAAPASVRQGVDGTEVTGHRLEERAALVVEADAD